MQGDELQRHQLRRARRRQDRRRRRNPESNRPLFGKRRRHRDFPLLENLHGRSAASAQQRLPAFRAQLAPAGQPRRKRLHRERLRRKPRRGDDVALGQGCGEHLHNRHRHHRRQRSGIHGRRTRRQLRTEARDRLRPATPRAHARQRPQGEYLRRDRMQQRLLDNPPRGLLRRGHQPHIAAQQPQDTQWRRHRRRPFAQGAHHRLLHRERRRLHLPEKTAANSRNTAHAATSW